MSGNVNRHGYEVVYKDKINGTETSRLAVPGGWLYKTWISRAGMVAVTTTFVPAAK